jgi:hypothetical protein
MAIEERVEIKIFYAHCLERKAFGRGFCSSPKRVKTALENRCFPAGDARPK